MGSVSGRGPGDPFQLVEMALSMAQLGEITQMAGLTASPATGTLGSFLHSH